MGLTAEMSNIGQIAYKKGIKEGIKEGMLETAKKMYKEGFDEEKIKRVTGLTKEKIKKN